ncbi:hypothetical protein HII36_29775 [Nonomuraea sp. NN258]|uniref:hypothetical protein n=1 Tax=Nonomuraea antri TaxID=2730852 RepID=UPI001569E48E|nr:hypothetical protein [Nonomuraea antri]NRQ35990.1 hypothetical protein [Nonomuraea antri]
MLLDTPVITVPGAIIGYRKDGRPIRLIAGGSGEDDTTQTDETATDSTADDGKPDDAQDKPDETGDKPDTGKSKPGDDLEFWKRKAREQETRAKANKQAADKAAADGKALLDKVAEALGLKSKDEDPKAVAEQLTTKLGSTEGALRAKTVELAVYKAAAKNGGDADALLDSRGFLRALDALDPSDDGFDKAVADAIQTAVKANPKLGAALAEEPKPKPSRSGGEIPGAPSGGSKRPAGGLAGAISKHYR